MTKNEFFNRYQSIYMFDNEDDSDYIEIIGSRKTDDEWEDYKDRVIITLDMDSCDIYQEFTYNDYDNLILVREVNREELLLIQRLGKAYGIPPALECFSGMGCPFTDEYVGYFNVKYDWEKIDCILDAFRLSLTYDESDRMDEEYLIKNFEADYCIYLQYEEDIKSAYRILMGANYSALSKRIPSKFKDVDSVYVDERGAFLTGIGADSLKKVIDEMQFCFEDVSEVYCGINYCFVRKNELTVSVDINYINHINMFMDIVKIEDKSFLEYRISPYNILVEMPYSDFWAIIMVLNESHDILAMKERKTIQEMYNKLLPFIPSELLYEEYSFSKLDDSAFEKMCRDLLVDMGFRNVIQRGKTHAPDDGIDLEADMIVKNVFGEHLEHWIFQCKHTKAQVGRKDISEIPDLLQEFNASGYGLFYSGMLSSQTLKRIKGKDVSIKYWAKGELEILLRKYKDTAIRYFGI